MVSRSEILERLEQYDLTDFQKKVLMATFEIKKGEVLTYKQLAEKVGKKKAYRAVGTVMKNNPIPITIPCHRVIRSDGKLGDYSGSGGTKRKRELLIEEGYIR